MSDLVVKRLREAVARGWSYFHIGDGEECRNVFADAADEITRLQKELETAREALEAVASILPKYAMKGDTASDDEALDAVLETVMDALKGGRE